MVNRYKDFATFSSVFSIAIAVVIWDFSRDWLLSRDVSVGLVLAIAVVIVVIIFQIMNLIIERFLNWAGWLRKLWLGNQYIEDIWIDHVKRDVSPYGFGVINVVGEDDSISFGGQDYDLAVEPQRMFHSHNVIINWPIITYIYTVQRTDKIQPHGSGYCEIRINETGSSSPNHWTGVFIDFFDGTRHDLEGWEIEDKSTIKKLNNPKTRKEIVKNLKFD